jgi:hypothetical protein
MAWTRAWPKCPARAPGAWPRSPQLAGSPRPAQPAGAPRGSRARRHPRPAAAACVYLAVLAVPRMLVRIDAFRGRCSPGSARSGPWCERSWARTRPGVRFGRCRSWASGGCSGRSARLDGRPVHTAARWVTGWPEQSWEAGPRRCGGVPHPGRWRTATPSGMPPSASSKASRRRSQASCSHSLSSKGQGARMYAISPPTGAVP